MMKFKNLIVLIIILITISTAASARVRTYRQTKDISIRENGKVVQSKKKGDLFEYTYDVDKTNKTVTRIKIRRLDQNIASNDNTVYTIKEIKKLLGSKAGRGGKIIHAVSIDGKEILELGGKFAFTTRTSSFSQVITGVYKRIYTKEDKARWRKKLQQK